MDENALEAMLARQRDAERGHRPQGSVRTERTDEFEVYERQAPAAQDAPQAPGQASPASAPADAPRPAAPPPEVVDDFGNQGASDFEELPGRQTSREQPPAPQAPQQPAQAPQQPAQAPQQPAQVPQQPVQAPPLEPAPQAAQSAQPRHTLSDSETVPTRRPQVWPPIQSRAATEDQEPPAEPAPRTHAPEPAASGTTHDGSGCRIAIVQALFNPEITNQMVEAAAAQAQQMGAEVRHRIQVPGVYDLPLAVQTLARRKGIDAVVVIGCVIQGETDHDDLITFTTAKTLQEIALATETPVALGIIGPGMTWEQAQARIGNAAHAVDAAVAQWRNLQTV